MNQTYKILVIIVILILIVSGLAYFVMNREEKNSTNNQDNSTNQNTATELQYKDLLKVDLKENQKINSPVTIVGKARGNWYFEASFPVKIYDGSNTQIGAGIATAIGDWMTTDYVPFSTIINFTTPSTPTGYIVFQKDNPSGLPENDDSFTVTVAF